MSKKGRIRELEKHGLALHQAGFDEGFKAGWARAVDYDEKYRKPAREIASDIDSMANLLHGALIAGFGDMPREIARHVSDDLARALNAGDIINRQWLRTFGTSALDLTGAIALRDALARYLSGEQKTTEELLAIVSSNNVKKLLIDRLREPHKPGRNRDAAVDLIARRAGELKATGLTWRGAGERLIAELSAKDDPIAQMALFLLRDTYGLAGYIRTIYHRRRTY